MNILWIFLIMIGIGAFLISLFLEFLVILSVTANYHFALVLTLVLECSKVLAIIFHRLVSDNKGYSIPDSVILLYNSFKLGLVVLSVICSIAIISQSVDQPNIDKIKTDDKKLVEDSYNEKLTLVQSQRQLRLDKITSEIKQKYLSRYQELDALFLPKIKETEKLRDNEFKNLVNGVRKGPFWYEYDRQLQDMKDEYTTKKDKLISTENTELNDHITSIETEFQKKIDDAIKEKDTAMTTIYTNDYKSDERVRNRIIVSFLRTLERGLGLKIEYLTFALVLSLLISVLLELSIYITFNYIIMFYSAFMNTSQKSDFLHSRTGESYSQQQSKESEKIYEPPVNDENLFNKEGIDPSKLEFLNDLYSQAKASNNIVNPCS